MEQNILLWIQQSLGSPILTTIMEEITDLANKGWFWILISLILVACKKTRTIGIAALISIVLGSIVTFFLKLLIARPRPFVEIQGLLPLIQEPTDYSFPSGHTCVSFAAAFVFYKMLPKKYGIPFLIIAALIAFSRMYLGVHYPSDILGGMVVAACSSMVAIRMESYKRFS